MKLDRLNRGEAIGLVSALALFVLMFFGWYGSEVSGQVENLAYVAASSAGSTWQSLGLISLVLALTIVVAVVAAALRAVGSTWQPAIPPSAAVAVLGGVSTLLIVFRILVPPGLGTVGGITIRATLELGAFLGLVAAAGIAYGGYRGMGERGTSFAKIADGLSAKPAGSAAGTPKNGSEKRPEPRI
jgi:hypothetical protein